MQARTLLLALSVPGVEPDAVPCPRAGPREATRRPHAIAAEPKLELTGVGDSSEVLLFDLA